jgi:sirohydrochlorin ferrochelatase
MAVKLTVLDIDSWPPDRADDAEWRMKILKLLLATGVDLERVRRVENGLIDTRVRPEELTAAGALAPWPVSFPTAEQVARLIVRQLEAAIVNEAG